MSEDIQAAAVIGDRREYLIAFLKGLEVAIPPPPTNHHAITFARYGSDETGWDDRLAIHISMAGDSSWRTLWLEAGDLDIPHEQLIAEIVEAGCPEPTDHHFMRPVLQRKPGQPYGSLEFCAGALHFINYMSQVAADTQGCEVWRQLLAASKQNLLNTAKEKGFDLR